MFDRFENRLTVAGSLVTQTGFRIGAGKSTEPVGTDLPLIKDALGRPFIPGSSFKGVLRGEVERMVRAVVTDTSGACIPTGQDQERCISRRRIAQLRDQHRGDDKGLAQAIQDESCLVCLTFGSPWLASHVQVRDLLVDEASWFGQFQVRDGVAIDRDKGTVAQHLLYSYETVPAGTRFDCHIVLENADDWQRGLLWIGLRSFLQGDAALGGFTSRGLGWVKLEDYELRLVKPEGDVGALIDALVGNGALVSEDDTKEWVQALKAKLRQRARVAEQKEAEDAQAATE
jgi:CRISPR-associated RAMP protein (TIGR02581 family)